MATANVTHFWEIMQRLRDLMAWCHHNKKDPWALRQALITMLELGKSTAYEGGVSSLSIARFDAAAVGTARRINAQIRRQEKKG